MTAIKNYARIVHFSYTFLSPLLHAPQISTSCSTPKVASDVRTLLHIIIGFCYMSCNTAGSWWETLDHKIVHYNPATKPGSKLTACHCTASHMPHSRSSYRNNHEWHLEYNAEQLLRHIARGGIHWLRSQHVTVDHGRHLILILCCVRVRTASVLVARPVRQQTASSTELSKYGFTYNPHLSCPSNYREDAATPRGMGACLGLDNLPAIVPFVGADTTQNAWYMHRRLQAAGYVSRDNVAARSC